MLLYAVTDRAWSDDDSFYSNIEKALKSGITCLQLREKELPIDKFTEEAKDVKKLCLKYDVPFIVNDNLEVAIRSKADGLHIGQNDQPINFVKDLVGDKLIIGVSAQTIDQAIEAEAHGADYLGLGAVFNTSTKLDAHDMPIDLIKKICSQVSIPTVAIGGINSNNIYKLENSGINGVAVVSGIFAQKNIEFATKNLLKLSRELFV